MRRLVASPLLGAVGALLVGLLTVPTPTLLGHVGGVSARSVAQAMAEAAELRPHVASHPKVLVIAHRGFSAIAPENTLPAMTAAAKAHADMVEFDVQRTLDGRLIVIHDGTFARTTNIASVFPSRVNDAVGSFTLADVERLDAGSWKGAQFAGTRIPTLDQLLTTMRPTSTNLLLELKNPARYPGYETQVAEALAAHGYIRSARVYVHSFDRLALADFHRVAPSVPLGLLTSSPVHPEGIDSWIHTVNPTIGSVNDAGVDRASAANLQVFSWPAGVLQSGAPEIERMVDDGVSGIITSDPRLIRLLISSAAHA
jgi:glycerophosphoryl diester phosphodiesterase